MPLISFSVYRAYFENILHCRFEGDVEAAGHETFANSFDALSGAEKRISNSR